jgi:cation transport ATPase
MKANQMDSTAATAPTTRRNARSRGMRQFVLGMVGYGIVVVLQGVFVEPEGLATWAAIALAVVPMAFAVWAMAGWLSAVRTFDELRQRIFSEAGLISLGATAVVTFTYGFLENFLGLPRLTMFVVFPFMALCYSLSLPYVFRRFR